MPQIVYRANLSASNFPFVSENWGRTVIVPGPDNTFNAQINSSEDTDKDVGIPQIYYCHNVVPNQQGFQSIAYDSTIGAIPITGSTGLFVQYATLSLSQNVIFGMTDAGNVYIYNGTNWTFAFNVGVSAKVMTTALVSGVGYLYIANYGCYRYDTATYSLLPVTLSGLVPANIKGIAPVAGYLIAWDNTVIYWSSTLDPTDFVPSLVTGASSGGVEAAKGNIVFCAPHNLGVMVYTTGNVVIALYTGNSRYPFNFREIVNSGGISDLDKVTYDANTGNQYAYTTSGVQLISPANAQTVFPEVTDFLAGQVFEDYDETTRQFVRSTGAAFLNVKIAMVADRYILLSYGLSTFTHALLYDIPSKRWGKLKRTHIQIIEYYRPVVILTETAKKSMGLLKNDGSMETVNFNPKNLFGNGVILLGKYQYARSRWLQLDEVAMENVQPEGIFTSYAFTSSNGKDLTYYPLSVIERNGLFARYGARAIGLNLSLALVGSFNLVSLVLTFNVHGKR